MCVFRIHEGNVSGTSLALHKTIFHCFQLKYRYLTKTKEWITMENHLAKVLYLAQSNIIMVN